MSYKPKGELVTCDHCGKPLAPFGNVAFEKEGMFQVDIAWTCANPVCDTHPITDTERIDWIKENEPYWNDDGTSIEFYLDGEWYEAEGDTFREAVDDAIKLTCEYWLKQPEDKRPEKYR